MYIKPGFDNFVFPALSFNIWVKFVLLLLRFQTLQLDWTRPRVTVPPGIATLIFPPKKKNVHTHVRTHIRAYECAYASVRTCACMRTYAHETRA